VVAVAMAMAMVVNVGVMGTEHHGSDGFIDEWTV